ncbi:hypothetical protein, partial [Rhodothalassium salexigens]|uniref:hypothetical protein n=1 Tax=Rhodothalassium salexigens TaxID=1086 RepID=UPI001A90E9AD
PASLAAARHYEGLEKRPLLVRHQPANQDRLPKASLESRFDRLGNPLRQQDLLTINPAARPATAGDTGAMSRSTCKGPMIRTDRRRLGRGLLAGLWT